MICNGTARADGRQLAAYLQARGDNDCKPEIIEQTAYLGMSVDFALRAMEAEAIGSKCRLPLYHAQISPAPGEHLTREQFMETVKLYEEEMGFSGLSRVVAIHTKHGQEHAHVVWGRIDPETGKARTYEYDYKTQERVARIIETRFNLRQVQGKWCALDGTYFTPEQLRDNARNRKQESKQTNRAEQAQEKRGAKPKQERQAEIKAIWQTTTTGRELREKLAEAGYTLARGDRRTFVVVDRAGEAHSLARQAGVTTKELNARLVDINPSSIPSVAEVREAMRRTSQDRAPLARDAPEQVQEPRATEQEPEPIPQVSPERQTPTQHGADGDLALEELTRHHSTFTQRDLERYAREATHTTADANELVAAVEEHRDLVHLGLDRTGRERFTSRDMLATELRMEAAAGDLANQRKHRVHPRIQDAVPNIDKLSDEQAAAYRHVMSPEGLTIVEGMAGTGKSYMLGAARKAFVAAGYRVTGAALSGIAAEGLQTGSQIQSRTLHSLIKRLDEGKLQLGTKDIIVLDEAAMVGSRQMSSLLVHVEKARAKLVLVGDAEQLQAIDAGGAFRALQERHGSVALAEVRRQETQWQRSATREFATAETAEALERYRRHGLVHETGSRDEAKDELIAAWTARRQSHPDERQIIMAYTRADVRDLNDRARQAYRDEGRLGPDHTVTLTDREGLAHRTKLAVGDRVYCMQNDTRLGVKNGTLATVTEIEGKRVAVRLDDGRKLTVDTGSYSQLAYGYSSTVHKSQGVTVDRSYMLASRFVDRHAAYVGMTRHRQQADLYWSREEFRSFEKLTATMSRDHRKDTVLDYVEKAEKGGGMRESLRAAAATLWREIKGAFRFERESVRPQRADPAFTRETVREPEQRFAPPRVDPAHARETVRAPKTQDQEQSVKAEALRQENARRQHEQETRRQTR